MSEHDLIDDYMLKRNPRAQRIADNVWKYLQLVDCGNGKAIMSELEIERIIANGMPEETDVANARIAELEAQLENSRSLLQKSDDRVVRLHERIDALEAQLAEANARAEAAEKKARDLALVIETAPTYAEPRIAAQVINQLTERAEQAEAREGRLREAIESVFQEKRGGVYFSFSAKNGLSCSYWLDEDRAEAVRGILQVLKAATRPDCGAAGAERETP